MIPSCNGRKDAKPKYCFNSGNSGTGSLLIRPAMGISAARTCGNLISLEREDLLRKRCELRARLPNRGLPRGALGTAAVEVCALRGHVFSQLDAVDRQKPALLV